jgi:hypothetical protein
MTNISEWSTLTDEKVGRHHLQHVTTDPADLPKGVEWAAAALPEQYASPKQIARRMKMLGKEAAAKYIANKLPVTKRARSADLGEILGSAFADENLGYSVIARLRWKDHREMAMRGEDIIGVRPSAKHDAEFLKGEVKSRARLAKNAVDDAEIALDKDNGRPSAHALEFIADRLHEEGEDDLADLIDRATLASGISRAQVAHLLFTFSGNDPRTLLRDNLSAYKGQIRRLAVGMQVQEHQKFIADAYGQVIADGREH